MRRTLMISVAALVTLMAFMSDDLLGMLIARLLG